MITEERAEKVQLVIVLEVELLTLLGLHEGVSLVLVAVLDDLLLQVFDSFCLETEEDAIFQVEF